MATQQTPTFVTLSDVLKKRGIEALAFTTSERKLALAESSVVFCTTHAEKRPNTNPEIKAEWRWDLTVMYVLGTGERRKEWLTLGPSEARDEVIQAITDALDEMEKGGVPKEERVVHGLVLEAIHIKKYDNPYFQLALASDKGLSCECSR